MSQWSHSGVTVGNGGPDPYHGGVPGTAPCHVPHTRTPHPPPRVPTHWSGRGCTGTLTGPARSVRLLWSTVNTQQCQFPRITTVNDTTVNNPVSLRNVKNGPDLLLTFPNSDVFEKMTKIRVFSLFSLILNPFSVPGVSVPNSDLSGINGFIRELMDLQN